MTGCAHHHTCGEVMKKSGFWDGPGTQPAHTESARMNSVSGSPSISNRGWRSRSPRSITSMGTCDRTFRRRPQLILAVAVVLLLSACVGEVNGVPGPRPVAGGRVIVGRGLIARYGC